MKQFEPTIMMRDPRTLTPYTNNAKIHTTAQIDKIAGQIHSVGFTQPIVIDKDGVIIAGHGRREAALRLNMTHVPVIVADHLDENEIRAARIADNAVARGEIDQDKLRFDLGTLYRQDFDLKLTGFELGEIEKVLIEESEQRQEQESQETEKQESPDEKTQFIVTTHLENEDQMQAIYEELTGRGFKCKLIT